jgi:hypothetical protein
VFSVIADVFRVMSADPSNATPDIFLEVARVSAVVAAIPKPSISDLVGPV